MNEALRSVTAKTDKGWYQRVQIHLFKIALIITTFLLYPLKELKWPRDNHAFKCKTMPLNLVTVQISCHGCWNSEESVSTARWNHFCGTFPSLAQACRRTDNKPQTQYWFGFKAKERRGSFHLCQFSLCSSVWDHINAIELSKRDLNFQYNFHKLGPLVIPSLESREPLPVSVFYKGLPWPVKPVLMLLQFLPHCPSVFSHASFMSFFNPGK